ncbi:MAG: NosD domain-containing protein [Planctomycetota bacterium]|jgi:parallel beta-helix repeat protein
MKKLAIIFWASTFLFLAGSPANARPRVWAEVADGVFWGYEHIQDGIDAAMATGWVFCDPGVYEEQLVIDKCVFLDGFARQAILQPTASVAAGVYDIKIIADGVIIQDFTLDFNGTDGNRPGTGVVVSDLDGPNAVDVQIINNDIYTGDGSAAGGVTGSGTAIQTGKNANVSNLLIQGNTIYGDPDGLGEGVYINPGPGTGIKINDNTVLGYLFSGVSIEASNVEVCGNTINSNIQQGYYGIRYIDFAGGATFSGVSIGQTDKGNSIENVQYGIRVGTSSDVGSTLTAEITDNTITDNEIGVWARYGADVAVHNNIIDNNSYGVKNDVSVELDATCNWWGDATGPYHGATNPSGLGDSITDYVYYSPWSDSNTLEDCNTFNEPVTNITQNKAYYYIQDAIDEAHPNDVIECKSQVYDEDLVIDKALTVHPAESNSPRPTIKGQETESWGSWPLAVPNIDIRADGAKIEGFIIESPNVPDGNYSSGMVIAGTDVEISDNSFVSIGDGDGGCVVIQTYRDSVLGYDNDISGLSIHDNTFSGTPDLYVGVWINHTLTSSGPVTIANNTFSGNIYQGIVTERSNTAIRHNSLNNALDKVGYGMIVMDWGPAGNKVDPRPQDNVQIKDNTTGNFEYGALIGTEGQALTDVTLVKNIIRDVNTAVKIRSSADGVSLNFNNLIRADAYAVLNTDPNNTVDAESNWWGEPDEPNASTGPLDDSDDRASGGLYNPGGLGEPVSDQVDYDPWLTVPISDSDDPVAYVHGDVNGDGCVNWEDFAILANHWLEGCE